MHFDSGKGQDDEAPTDDDVADIVDLVNDRLLASPEISDEAILQEFPDHADTLCELLPTLRTIASVGVEWQPENVPLTKHATVHKQLGEFVLLREVGGGGMGVVYE
ncbi:MAG: hypothetical protein KDA61_01930, partial [Planctomycetales bacterium]|nr:hypothetical protein [Planctomycetales bacterium]